ncbi:MAG: PEP-CTERM sorting domain-containing protein, partial [Phycisphaerae bacterium]
NDDRGLGYIDVDNDGVFNDTDRIAGYAWNSNGNKVLVAGRQYNFIYMAQEHAGGDNIWFAYTPPGGGEAVVNPTTQAGEWMIRTGAEVFGDIEVVSGAKLSLKGFTNAGEVTIGAGATLALGAYDSNCQDLKLDPMGLLDVGQSLFIMSDPDITLAGVIGDIQTGRNGGGWDGANWVGGNWNGTTGITSSTLIGHELEWSLVAFDPNRFNSDEEVVIRLTIIGDVDIDCDVDEDDRAIMEANFGQAGGWGDGDVDYSGVVDFRDYLLWKAFQGQDYTGPGAVPEPATLVLLAFGGVAILARRRRRK